MMTESASRVPPQVVDKYRALSAEWNNQNVPRVGQLLDDLKVQLTNMTFLPAVATPTQISELKMARDILEIGAMYSIAIKDIPSFERYMAQLKTYYFDYHDAHLPESVHMYQLLGLNLLCLLSQNRVAEFHTELELLPVDKIQNDVYISHPIALEQYLMEGRYNKVFLSRNNVPAQSFTFFIDILLNTTRKEIAACIEKSYEKLSVREAARMMFLSSPTEVMPFAQERRWNIVGDHIIFMTPEQKAQQEANLRLPAVEVAQQAVEYAIHLEQII